MNSTQATPPPLPTFDAEAFRRKLAGFSAPAPPGETEVVGMRDDAVRFATILADVFGPDLDRITLWSRIESALETACARESEGDLERWVTLCLEHVKAEPSKCAACMPLGQTLESFAVKPLQWRLEFLRYVNSRRYVVVVRARARWEDVKEKRAEL